MHTPDQPPSAPGRAIVVDDNPLNLYYAGRVLREQGYDIVRASNYYTALKAFDDLGCVLLLADIRLPAGSGLDLARIARERRPDIKILMMTAFTEEELRARDLNIPVLRVPFSRRSLGNELRRLFA